MNILYKRNKGNTPPINPIVIEIFLSILNINDKLPIASKRNPIQSIFSNSTALERLLKYISKSPIDI